MTVIKKKLVFVIILLVIACFIPLFVKSPYFLDLFVSVMINSVLAMTFIMGMRAGLINLGIIAFWGVGAYSSAILSLKFSLNVWLCLPIAAMFTGIFAFLFGFILIRRGGSGFSFVIFSIIIGMIFNLIVGSITYFGAWSGIHDIPPPNPIRIPFLPALEFVSVVQFFYLGLFIFIVIALISYAFYASWVGRAWTAIGLSPQLGESLGVNVFGYRLLAFVVSSALCGLIGAFYAHYRGFISPDSFGMWQNIYVQIYAILGGVSFVFAGPIVGAAVMTFLPEFIRGAKEVAPIITGGLLVLLIMFLPEGLLGLSKYRSNIDKILRMIKRPNTGTT